MVTSLEIIKKFILSLYDTTLIRDISVIDEDDDVFILELIYAFNMDDEDLDGKLTKSREFLREMRRITSDPKIDISSPKTYVKDLVTDDWFLMEHSYYEESKRLGLKIKQVFKIRLLP